MKHELDKISILFNQSRHLEIKELLYESTFLNNTTSVYVKLKNNWLIGAISNYIEIPVKANSVYFLNLLNKGDLFEKKLQHNLKPIEYKIIKSLIVHYIYETQIDHAEKLLISSIQNYDHFCSGHIDTSYVRFIYNLCKLYYDQEKYSKAIPYCQKWVTHCLSNNDISYLADIYIIWGQCEIGC